MSQNYMIQDSLISKWPEFLQVENSKKAKRKID